MASAMEVEPVAVLEAHRKAHPELNEQIDDMLKFFGQKLYHQLTQALVKYLENPVFSNTSAASELLELFDGFIKQLDGKVDKVKFVQMLSLVSGVQSADKALELVTPFEATAAKHRDSKFMWQALHAEKLILAGKMDAAKDALESLGKEVTEAYEVDPLIQSQLHKTSGLLWKTLGRPQEFFKSSILYLAFTPLAAIPENQRARLAFEIGVAALSAPEEFEFGELMQQELLVSLKGSEHEWIAELLKAFGEGSFALFDAACNNYKARITATPELKNAESVLRTKMEALALMELAFRKPQKQRRLTFAEIAEHCRVQPKAVEFLVMRAMCAKLIKGQIDEVQQIVLVVWVKPRILDTVRVDLMREQMDAWGAKAGLLLDHLEEMTPELLVA